MFFQIWGEPLSRNRVGPYVGAVTAFVNGARCERNYQSIPLYAHQQIVLEVGSPNVIPPNYTIPPND
jgi:hypothetical protein